MERPTEQRAARVPTAPDVWRGTRALVLGAGGFVGRWVVRALAREGAEVHAAVRDARRAALVLRFPGRDPVLHEVDLSGEAAVAQLLVETAPDVVFDLAAHGVGRGASDPRTAELLNARLPGRIVRALPEPGGTRWSGHRILRAGTAQEYGAAHGTLEEDAECLPTTLYGRTKLEGTRELERASAERGIPALTARLFTLYGAGERAERLLPSLVRAAATGGTLSLTGGTQRRDFVNVEDAAEGLLRLAASRPRPGGVVNLASGRLASVREFALVAARVLGIAPDALRFGELPARPDEMEHEPVDVARLLARTGWSPPADLESGIARAVRAGDEESP